MTQEEKELLLKDLCARLPYEVMIKGLDKAEPLTIKILAFNMVMSGNLYLPYLRPMSSMTEEEVNEYNIAIDKDIAPERIVDWYNLHHFDYRGLIEKGLALEAPKDMYN